MRLGEILIERKLISAEDLERALELQKERGDKIGKTLVDMGFIAMRDVLAALAEQWEVPLVTIDGPPSVSPETEALAPRFLRQFRCLPLSRDDHAARSPSVKAMVRSKWRRRNSRTKAISYQSRARPRFLLSRW